MLTEKFFTWLGRALLLAALCMYLALLGLPDFAKDTTGEFKGKLFNDARCTGVSVPVWDKDTVGLKVDTDGKNVVTPVTTYTCEVGIQVVKAFYILTIIAGFSAFVQFAMLQPKLQHVLNTNLFFYTWVSQLVSFLVYNSIYSELAWDAGNTWNQTNVRDGQFFIFFIVTVCFTFTSHAIYLIVQILFWDQYDSLKDSDIRDFTLILLSLLLVGGRGAELRQKINDGREKRKADKINFGFNDPSNRPRSGSSNSNNYVTSSRL
jgi:hypothetical protein